MHAASRNLTLEQHIRRKGALLAEIVAMRPPPGREGAVALALVKDKGLVDLVKTPLGQLDGLDHRHQHTGAVIHHPSLAGLGLWPLACRPIGHRFLPRTAFM